jgi:hypothetical protein
MHGGGRRWAVVMVAIGSLLGACTSSSADEPPERAEPPTSTTTSIAEPTTTTTTEPPVARFEPLIADPDQPIRDQVEAAYLYHWEVLMDAGRTGRTENLPLVFTGKALDLRTSEVEQFVDSGFVSTDASNTTTRSRCWRRLRRGGRWLPHLSGPT